MCLILLAFRTHPLYKLILAANRDEYYDRPAAPAGFWNDAPHLLAGKDLRSGGTWLGITTKGRIGALTNYRDPVSYKSTAPSRGNLVKSLLLGQKDPAYYISDLEKNADKYNGFNFIVGEGNDFYWYSNRSDKLRKITPGIYGLSNHFLDTPWPKVSRAKDAFKKLLSEEENPSSDDLFHLLRDRYIPDDEALPDTGVGIEWERILSTIFVTSPTYGTRSSAILSIDMDNCATFIERTYNSDPDHATTVEYEFLIEV